MEKQDRQGARTPAQLEQRYRFGKRFAEAFGLADQAREEADRAQSQVRKLDDSLTQAEIFRRLTRDGQAQGIYRTPEGEIYIHASYIKSGQLDAELIRSGVLCARDESAWFDLDQGNLVTSRQADVMDDQGRLVPGNLALYLDSGRIILRADELEGLVSERLRIEAEPQAPADGSVPGCRIWDGGSESEFPRGLAITPVGNLWLGSGQGAVALNNCRIAGLADPQEGTDGVNLRYLRGQTLQVEAGVPVALPQGGALRLCYLTSHTGNNSVTVLLNGQKPTCGSYQYGAEQWSNGIITQAGADCPGDFAGTLELVAGRALLHGSGLRGNGSGLGHAALQWQDVQQLENITFSHSGTLTVGPA